MALDKSEDESDGDTLTPVSQRLQQRNQAIGALLAQIREARGHTISECASLLGTSRRRYRAIEAGTIGISVAELELLAEFLDVELSAFAAWTETNVRRVIIPAQPGETVQIIVEISGQTDDVKATD